MQPQGTMYSLRFLSGPHAGAEAVLGAGEYVVGSDANSDVILQDPAVAPRHLLLVLGSEEMAVEPFEEGVYLEGREVSAGRSPLASFQVLTVGATCLALALRGELWPEVALPVVQRASGEPVQGIVHEPDGANVTDEPDESGAVRETGEDGPADRKDAAGQAEGGAQVLWMHWKPALGFVGLLVLFWLMVHALWPASPEQAVQADPVAALEAVLDNLGIEGARVVRKGDGLFSMTGYVSTVEQRRALNDALRTLPFSVTLDVRVTGQLMQAVREVLRMLALEMEVEDMGQGVVRIHGYSGDDAVLARLEKQLADDVPGLNDVFLDAVKLVEVYPVLNRLLLREGLSGMVGFEPHPGWIAVSGTLDLDQRAAWSRVKEALADKLGMTVPFRESFTVPLSPLSVVTPMKEQPGASSPPKEVGTGTAAGEGLAGTASLSGLNIRSISLLPIPSFVTDQGERYFEGARLSDGSVVMAIGVRGIVIRQNGMQTTVPIGGKQ